MASNPSPSDLRSLCDEVDRIDQEASKGPWRVCSASAGRCSCGFVWAADDQTVALQARTHIDGEPNQTREQATANQHFAADARTLLPLLTAAIRGLLAREEAVMWRKEAPTVTGHWWYRREPGGYACIKHIFEALGGSLYVREEFPTGTFNNPLTDYPGEWAPCIPPEVRALPSGGA